LSIINTVGLPSNSGLKIKARNVLMKQFETITRKGKKYALIPLRAFKKLMADAEMLADIAAYDAAKKRIDSGEDELIPFELVERRISGENAVKIWREYRGLTQEKLAKVSGVSRIMIAAIESGHKKGGITTIKKLANALRLSADEIV
jgi:DNA-binding XRE family transcriptional regulator